MSPVSYSPALSLLRFPDRRLFHFVPPPSRLGLDDEGSVLPPWISAAPAEGIVPAGDCLLLSHLFSLGCFNVGLYYVFLHWLAWPDLALAADAILW